MGLVTSNQFNLQPNIFGQGGAVEQGLNLGEQFRQRQLQAKQEEFLQGGGLDSPTAIQDAAKVGGLDFATNVANQLGLVDEQTGQIDQKRLNEAADFSFGIQDLPIERQNIRINKRIEEIEARGGDATQTRELLTLPLEERAQGLLGVQLAALPNDVRLKVLQGVQASAGQREFEALIADFSEEDKVKARRVKARIDAPAGTSAAERIAGDPTVTEQVAESQGIIAAKKETAKLSAQLSFKPLITKAVKEAEILAKQRGDVFTDLNQAEAAIPGLRTVVGKLKVLSDEATFTLGGQGFDIVAKQVFGFATKGATARDKMISVISNQVLPLLKPIFGSQFTEREGDRLIAAFADVDSTPESRKDQLDSFLAQMERNIESKRREQQGINAQQPQQAPTTGQPVTQVPEGQQPVSLGASDQPEGTTATGPNNQRIITRNGKWVVQ